MPSFVRTQIKVLHRVIRSQRPQRNRKGGLAIMQCESHAPCGLAGTRADRLSSVNPARIEAADARGAAPVKMPLLSPMCSRLGAAAVAGFGGVGAVLTTRER